MASDVFRIAFVPGVTPDKWLRTWHQRHPDLAIEATPLEQDAAFTAVRDGAADMALLRLPIERDGLHCIPLYDEDPVVVASKEHLIAATSADDEVDVSDLADDVLMQPKGVVPEWDSSASESARQRSEGMPRMSMKDAVSVVAAGSGIVIVPLSVARLHQRKDVVRRPVGGVARSAIGLVWQVETEDPRVEQFIGIVRGRTERSSRGDTPATSTQKPPQKPRDTPKRADGPGAKRSTSRSGSGPRGGGPKRSQRRGKRR